MLSVQLILKQCQWSHLVRAVDWNQLLQEECAGGLRRRRESRERVPGKGFGRA